MRNFIHHHIYASYFFFRLHVLFFKDAQHTHKILPIFIYLSARPSISTFGLLASFLINSKYTVSRRSKSEP